jgi:hypothetical protein
VYGCVCVHCSVLGHCCVMDYCCVEDINITMTLKLLYHPQLEHILIITSTLPSLSQQLASQPHHQRPKQPTDYIVLNGSLDEPSIGTVRICYYMVLSGGPVTTLAVQTPLRSPVHPKPTPPVYDMVDNHQPFEESGDGGSGGGSSEVKQQEWAEADPMDDSDYDYFHGNGNDNGNGNGNGNGDVETPELKQQGSMGAKNSMTELEEEYHQKTAAMDDDEETAGDSGTRSPSVPIQFTFRPFTEKDAHRTLAWAWWCGGQGQGQGQGQEGGAGAGEERYGRYIYSPHSASFSSYPSFSSSSKVCPPSTSSSPPPSKDTSIATNTPTPTATSTASSAKHEYQSLDRGGDTTTQTSRATSSECCPAINSFVGEIVGTEVILLEERFVSKDSLFEDKLKEFQKTVLITRVGSYLMLSLAFFLILKPIASVLSFLPYIGTFLLNFFWIASLLGGFLLGMVVSAMAWVLYRPYFLAGKIGNFKYYITTTTVYIIVYAIELIDGLCIKAVCGIVLCGVLIACYLFIYLFIFAGLFIVIGGLLTFFPGHPETLEEREAARTLKVTGYVFLVVALLPMSLGIYQMIEERRFRQLQKLLDDKHNEHTHRHMTIMAKKQAEAEDDVRTRDTQALTLFAMDEDKHKRRGREASSSSASSSGYGSPGNSSQGATEATHLLAHSGLDDEEQGGGGGGGRGGGGGGSVWRSV